MKYSEWLEGVSDEIKQDALWKMEVYRTALLIADLAWTDATKLMRDKRTISLSDQLYRAVGSVSANIAEGYSRSTGKDRARFYAYSLGSAREARDWYFKARHILGESVASHRTKLLTEIIRQLLIIIPKQRGDAFRTMSIKESSAEYNATTPTETNFANLLNKIP